MPAIEVELVVFTLENGELKILLEPDLARPGYRRLPWRIWEHEDNFIKCVTQVANEVAPERMMEPVFFGNFSMPNPRKGLVMSFYLCVSADRWSSGERGAYLNEFARPADISHVYLTVLAQAIERLRKDQIDRALMPLLLPTEFTLLQLQDATETVTGKPLDKRHFRRQIQDSGWLEETGTMSGGAHRPAKMYQVAASQKRRVAA